MLKPASSGCNLRCAYCFYADEARLRGVPNYGQMPADVSHALIERAVGAAEGSVTFPFQRGIPVPAVHPLCRNGCRRDRMPEEGKLERNYYCQA